MNEEHQTASEMNEPENPTERMLNIRKFPIKIVEERVPSFDGRQLDLLSV
jgi:hypothetical protein